MTTTIPNCLTQAPPTGPIIPIFPYEQRFLDDPARLIGWTACRQGGKSFTAGLKVALHALRSGENWNTMSRSQRQAEWLLERIGQHIKACNEYAIKTLGRAKIYEHIGTEQIRLATRSDGQPGARITAVPCDPDTTVGDTANWLIDEFAKFEKSERVFGIVKPSIRWGKRLLIVSTPNGRRNKFFKLARRAKELGPASGWSWHTTTIDDAVRDGCPLMDHEGNPVPFDEWRKQEIADMGEELYAQEYMCVFSDKLIVFLPHDLIISCQAANLPLVRTPFALRDLSRDLYVGVDVGFKRDRTVFWIVSRTGDTLTTESVFVFDRPAPVDLELRLAEILKTGRVAKCLIDQQGVGMHLATTLATSFPGTVEPITFTNPLKSEMAHRVKVAMQAGAFWIPPDDEIVEDFSSLERNVTEAGREQLTAPSGPTGHADRFWAAALAVHGAVNYKPFELVMAL
jgi:phage FluMu gp28-like protein